MSEQLSNEVKAREHLFPVDEKSTGVNTPIASNAFPTHHELKQAATMPHKLPNDVRLPKPSKHRHLPIENKLILYHFSAVGLASTNS
jgi:hypothetical protein